MPVFEIFNNEMQRIKSKAPASYATHVVDTEKRLNILFDLLNNGDRTITEDIANRLKGIAMAIQSRDHTGATNQHTETLKALAQGSPWMVRPAASSAAQQVLTGLGRSQATDSNEQGYSTLSECSQKLPGYLLLWIRNAIDRSFMDSSIPYENVKHKQVSFFGPKINPSA